ncbi:PKD domain-containing protein [Aquimarina sp. BL5]|uniref:PKD domain-containing protein n=1 Tax=Aquimarina sp. BL5 TaxID=1714860 RepID=UPI000E47AB72|nr:PKD domain-containing protein [Aquimarina sp. BL5]AXT53265.1 PKD domain-containing protein [Aquimarina sp. BL5]RKN03209.1 PKD domain-containing protein [Aquimarina sp. BL5]
MKTNIKTLLIASLLFGMQLLAQKQKAAPMGFVYAEEEKFMLDGRPYYFSGANVYDFFTYGSSSGDIETQFMDKDRIDEHMRRLYVNGIRVVRLWGFSHEDWHGFEPQKGVYSEAQFSLFDYIIKSAEANGIKLIIALENYWNDYGGIKDRLKWEGIDVQGAGEHDQGQFFTNASALQGYKDYVEYFLTRVNHYDNVEYRNDPTILAWELMNEPRYQGFGDDVTSDVLRAWVDDMGAFIKAIDPNHLLGTGLEAHGTKYNFGGDEGNDFIKIHESPYVDFTSAHPYIRESWSNFTLEQTMKLMEQWANESHNIIKKPLYIGEFNVEIQERFEWWEEMYAFIEENKIGASGFWWFPDNNTPRDKFGVFEGDVEVAIYKEHALRMEEMSGGEAIYLSLLSPKSGDTYVTGSMVHIEANLLNENNTIKKVEFFSNGELVGEDTTAPYELDVSGLADGNYTITSVATGINGITKNSTPRNIQIGGNGVLSLEYKDASADALTNVIKPHFRLFNNSSQDVAYSDLSIRYWFETEVDLPLNFFIDYAMIGSSNVNGQIVNMEGNKHYLEITFDPATGILGRNAGSGRMEPKIANSNWSETDQTNDYSYDGTKKEFAEWERVALYLNGKLVSGIEPGTSVDTPTAVINASAITGDGPLSVTFDGSGSTDPNGDILTYSWDFGNGDTATDVITSYEFTEFGEADVTLTVNDGNGNIDTETITITITDPNVAPVANFTSDIETGIAPVLITFDASSSTDVNNDVLSYSWDFGNGDTAIGVIVAYQFETVGEFDVKLTVGDGKIEDSITKKIIISDGNPVANIVADVTSGPAPLEVTFDGSGSVDPSNNSLSYSWDFGDGTTDIGQTVVHTFDTVGSYIVTLEVNNGQGGVDTNKITVQVQEILPVSDISLEYRDGGNGSATDNMINPHFRISNNSDLTVSYQDITVRYWFTSEDNNNLNFWCDWAQLGIGFVNGVFGQQNGIDYLEVSFDPASGALTPGQNSGPIQTRFAKANWSNFDENDDYSYKSSLSDYQFNNEMTLYVEGNLVWGAEPAAALRSIDLIESVKVYPNPAKNHINISGFEVLEKTEVKLTNLVGNVIRSANPKARQSMITFSLDNLDKGIYILEIKDVVQNIISRRKIVVNK